MQTIRLTITPEIRDTINTIKSKYPVLSDPEILKLGLSELYIKSTTSQKTDLNIDNLTSKGRKYFNKWLKQQGKDISTLTEDEAYNLIKNA
ncbi:hypothetical protein A3A93_01425 [Candidatus Roizmanbacteria bacterium RIFCSPLOWO2_01_FULL_38_12]|uniref:Uncharacterized protein n=1 Tax=Candidatus Roizmanbacteria bacterium RIFCSPLOWO2_01_FULL_38_12 TaxID=1802061 RepID=A0A1F7IY97_9BACT|nr:MAG: hypothetical protein A2861_00665 [Candidatus Roizmanbacteria bacterium RIFCSPHIGHO2_01_FULL_38_15]OGK34455.1 MAG: hypothetical protein A3F59_03955 [Candidatus Roizmanbacteria bacterium RIFCSPHIGHO2_12_FULL_38_13]OGK48285.1 MAG: hypothetical protein A3A93_01425 [Candidatus Roizmanbacteria bacterium RIFCSPLOWO2_01_FULL_38_12]